MADQPFLSDIQTLRTRVRQHLEQGGDTRVPGAPRNGH